MAPRNQEREGFVKALSKLAGGLGVERIAANSGKVKVEELIAAVGETVDCNGWGETEEAEWEAAVSAYLGSWPQAQEDEEKIEWKFMAVQTTYNCTTGEWASKDTSVQAALFERLKVFAVALGVLLGAVGVSVTLEWATKAMQHLHAHLYLHLSKTFHKQGRDALECFNFEGIRPHVEPNRASGKCFSGAVRFGHFYVYVDKIGSVFAWSDFLPFQGYGVEGWWLDNLLKQGKLRRDVYLKWAARVVIGFPRRLADVKAAERYEKEKAVEDAVAEEAAALADAVLPVRSFPEVDRFLACFERRGRFFRRPMLAIIGGTNLGKSVLAGDVLRRVGLMVDAPGFLEITVEENPSLDLAEFDMRQHAGVLLDGVGDALILKKNRESLQGRAKVCKGGQSATNMYAYKYTLARRAIVATFDLSAKNLEQFVTDHWLSCELNIIVLRLQEKAFLETTTATVADIPAWPSEPRAGKRRWLGTPPRQGLGENSAEALGR